MEIKNYGYAGHLCIGHLCRFHLTTVVGKYLVSTVGAYFRSNSDQSKMEEIGCDRMFETMVFKIGKKCSEKDCGCGLPETDGNNLDVCGYNTAGEAQIGHEKMVKKWSKK